LRSSVDTQKTLRSTDMDIDNDLQDAKRWRYLCDAEQLPIEIAMLLSMGADRETINSAIDKAMLGNRIETLN
jgi:hypothetical protein